MLGYTYVSLAQRINFSRLVWAPVLLPPSVVFFYWCDLSFDCIYFVFAFWVFTLTLPLMSLSSVLPSPLPPFLFSSPSAVSIQAPPSVLYLSLTSCVLKLHSLLWERAKWIEGLTVRKPIPSLGLTEHISYSSPLSLLCPKTLLWPILSPLPPAAHCSQCLRSGVILKEDVFQDVMWVKEITHKHKQSTDCIFGTIFNETTEIQKFN